MESNNGLKGGGLSFSRDLDLVPHRANASRSSHSNIILIVLLYVTRLMWLLVASPKHMT